MRTASTPALRKQAILYFLNTNGESNRQQIEEYVGISKGTTNRYLREMRNDDEVAVHEAYQGKVLIVTYTAKVLHTTTGVRTTVPKKKSLTYVSERGGVVHLGTERDHPLPHAGGQGAVRYDFGIQASAGWL